MVCHWNCQQNVFIKLNNEQGLEQNLLAKLHFNICNSYSSWVYIKPTLLTVFILDMGSANERPRYNVTVSPIGYAHKAGNGLWLFPSVFDFLWWFVYISFVYFITAYHLGKLKTCAGSLLAGLSVLISNTRFFKSNKATKKLKTNFSFLSGTMFVKAICKRCVGLTGASLPNRD